METLLKIKKAKKKRKPNFVQTDTHWKKRIKAVWRKPRGLHNKMRLSKKDYPCTVKPGYRTPKLVRGLSSDGKSIAVISTLNELKSLDKNTIAEIKSSVGNKKRIVIMQEAKTLGIKIKNVKSIDTALDKIQKLFTARKEERKKRFEKRLKKSKKKKEEKKEKTIEETIDKEQEKKEQEKTLKKRI